MTSCHTENLTGSADKDEFRCPAGQALIWRFASIENGLKNHRYWSSNCKECPLKAKCTPSQQRRVTRWEHQDVLDDMQARLDQNPDAMRIRRSSVEHPYGTIKSWMGATHFLSKGLERVKTEMSLHVLAYNFRRLMAILGKPGMVAAIRAYARFLKRSGLLWGLSILDKLKSASITFGRHGALNCSGSLVLTVSHIKFAFLHSLGRSRPVEPA
jgi:hypothetical protein